MRIAQLSDFHFARITWNPFRLASKRIFGSFNWWLNRRYTFSEKQLESLPALFRSLHVDLILLGGDFTTTAMREEFAAAKAFVDQFDAPWIAIPGNHDQYTYRSFRQKHFYRYFSKASSLERCGIEVHSIVPHWWLIALDTAVAMPPWSSQGIFSEALERSLEEALQKIPASDSVLLFNHYPLFQNGKPQHALRRAESLEALVKRHKNVCAYLHGHTHRHTIADLQPNDFPLILDSGSATNRSNGWWNLLDLSDEGCRITGYQCNEGEWKPRRIEQVSWTRR